MNFDISTVSKAQVVYGTISMCFPSGMRVVHGAVKGLVAHEHVPYLVHYKSSMFRADDIASGERV